MTEQEFNAGVLRGMDKIQEDYNNPEEEVTVFVGLDKVIKKFNLPKIKGCKITKATGVLIKNGSWYGEYDPVFVKDNRSGIVSFLTTKMNRVAFKIIDINLETGDVEIMPINTLGVALLKNMTADNLLPRILIKKGDISDRTLITIDCIGGNK